ncbi:MAG: hypothetical protein M3Y66_08535 [Actinomycetota bacterium]|nr:hypothetical protein [Actinomycetota bacterium]
MSRPLVVLLLLVGLAASACSGGDVASPEVSGSASDSASTSGTPATVCRPSHRVTLTRREPRVLYALRFTVAPGGRATGSQDATLYTYPSVSAGVYVDRPAGTRLDPRTAAAILAEVPRGTPLLDGVRGLSWDVRNHGPTRARYLVYAGATVYRARWTARACDGPVRRLEGTMVLIGRIREGLERCGESRPGDPLRRVALVTACHHDPVGYRQFRDPTG